MKHSLRPYARFALYIVYVSSLCWLLLFSLLEFRPDLLHHLPLQNFSTYYAVRFLYSPDDDLVFTYRLSDGTTSFVHRGDLASFVPFKHVPTLTHDASYRNGFRSNTSPPPFDVVVIGDSFVETGEDDLSTFPELVREVSGLTVMNLGRSWYGPSQYLEILKRYALPQNPRFVVLCFFAGNDWSDLREYENWELRGRYYYYRDLESQPVPARFLQASWSMAHGIAQIVRNCIVGGSRVGQVEVGGVTISKAFGYWEGEDFDDQIPRLKFVLDEFVTTSRDNGITPIFVYVPTALQVYHDRISEDSSKRFLRRLGKQRPLMSEDEAVRLAHEAGFIVLNLLPDFRRYDDRLLYYQFDSHWNRDGRHAGAIALSAYLDEQLTGDKISVPSTITHHSDEHDRTSPSAPSP